MSRQRRQACGFMDNASALPTSPQNQHPQQNKADICTRYRHGGVNSVIDTTPMDDLQKRSWGYVTLGFGRPLISFQEEIKKKPNVLSLPLPTAVWKPA